MATGQTVINNALIMLGILEQGGTPSPSDSSDALAELNTMWEAWGIDEGLIYAIASRKFPIAASIAFYALGPGAIWDSPIPGKIYEAIFCSATGGAIATSSLKNGGSGYAANDTGIILGAGGTRATYTVNTVDASGAVLTYTISAAGTGYIPGYGYDTATAGAQPGIGARFTLNILTVTAGGQNRNPLKIVESTVYHEHNDLQASALTPDELYPDFDIDFDGFMKLYLFPVPSGAATLELLTGIDFADWTLVDEYRVPRGLRDDIEKALAWRLIPRFGSVVDQKVAEIVAQLGQKAEARVRTMNENNRQLNPQAAGIATQSQQKA